MEQAVCASVDPELWHPDKSFTALPAKRICWGFRNPDGPCPVREQCLAYALDNDEQYGVWGGMSERQRKHMKPGPGKGRGLRRNIKRS